MNLHSVFEELNKLYESMEKPVKESVEEVAEEAEVEEVLTEAAEESVEEPVEEADDEIEIVDDEEEAEEAPAVDEEIRIVLECSNCGGLKIIAEAEAAIDEETDLVNVGDACQYCEGVDGYKIVGSLAPYGDVAVEVADEEVVEDEVIEDEVVEEGLLDVDLPISVDVQANGNDVTVGGIS